MARAGSPEPVRAHRPVDDVGVPALRSADRAMLRLGAVAIVAGIVLQVVMEALHPSRENPNDSAAAFAEYARSGVWTAVHIGQFLAALLIVLALVALAGSLARQPGTAGALAMVARVTAVLVAGVFAVQMAVDGVALKAAIHAWLAAPAADRAAAFLVAEGVRALEKALSGFFHLLNGTTLLALGLSMTLGRSYSRGLGVLGAVAGLALLVGGVVTAHTGFSMAAGRVLLPATVLTFLYLLGASVAMWRHGTAAAQSPS
ncbi:hypothetical protein [Georgenia sp. SYP-B2076]|uniref:hypothetical protein n=1 Tax=Georgenia sp. SYP-B2076 TaxID=2495881 RepID=UPI000F8EC5B3|nr:hypothetical protein [Georgenia sp. SYP-B2076]